MVSLTATGAVANKLSFHLAVDRHHVRHVLRDAQTRNRLHCLANVKSRVFHWCCWLAGKTQCRELPRLTADSSATRPPPWRSTSWDKFIESSPKGHFCIHCCDISDLIRNTDSTGFHLTIVGITISAVKRLSVHIGFVAVEHQVGFRRHPGRLESNFRLFQNWKSFCAFR